MEGGPAVEHIGGEEAEDEGGHRDQRQGCPAAWDPEIRKTVKVPRTDCGWIEGNKVG